MRFGFVDRTSTHKPSAAELLGRPDAQDLVDELCAYTSPTSALVLAPSGAAAPAIPLDPTLPVALGAGIPLAEAVAETALITAAGALWTALASAAYPGALA